VEQLSQSSFERVQTTIKLTLAFKDQNTFFTDFKQNVFQVHEFYKSLKKNIFLQPNKPSQEP